MSERETAIRDVCGFIAQCGMDSTGMNFAIGALEYFGLPLAPTFLEEGSYTALNPNVEIAFDDCGQLIPRRAKE